MGYNQNNTIKMIQIILQDCQRLDIQIIGYVKEAGEYIATSDGKITASDAGTISF